MITHRRASAGVQGALAILTGAIEAREIKSLVGIKTTNRQVGPVEPRLLVVCTLIVRVGWVGKALGAAPVVCCSSLLGKHTSGDDAW